MKDTIPQNTDPTIWDVMPNFSQMWESDNNYGFRLRCEGLYASVSTYTVRRSGREYVHYLAIVQGWDLPRLQNDSVQSIKEAKEWCESWMRHFYKQIQLNKQVACYRSWLDYYREKLTKVQDRLNEETREKIRRSFREVLGAKDDGGVE